MESSNDFPAAFLVHAADNVATLLAAATTGKVLLRGAADGYIDIRGDVELGHKVAVRRIKPGEFIVKFGVVIGQASSNIEHGDWVHLHNCTSLLDERSSTLDLHTGLPGDTRYE